MVCSDALVVCPLALAVETEWRLSGDGGDWVETGWRLGTTLTVVKEVGDNLDPVAGSSQGQGGRKVVLLILILGTRVDTSYTYMQGRLTRSNDRAAPCW